MIIAGKYNADMLADIILKKYSGIRASSEYMQERNRLIDETMSCNRDEQRGWMRFYMTEAVHMDKSAPTLHINTEAFRHQAAVQYIVAYDLY